VRVANANSGNASDGELVLACETKVSAGVSVFVPEQQTQAHVLVEGQGSQRPHRPFLRRGKDGGLWAGEARLGEIAREQRLLALAVDVGTTTLAVRLLDLDNGATLATASGLNPQTEMGGDVLSRIRVGAERTGLLRLQSLLVDALNALIRETTKSAGVAAESIYEICLAGNTCMLHLAVGASPDSLGRTPFLPSITGGEHRRASELGLRVAPQALVYLPPVFSGFVGADISAGVLATELAGLDGVTLFLDIGTNGEMVLARDGALWVTSTAAGPAFEGVNISQGMRAAPGAIDAVVGECDRRTVRVIGGVPAKGICGSGLLDLVGTLVETGGIGPDGRFRQEQPPAVGTWRSGASKAVALTEAVALTQKDVRQVQLAKAAIRAGIDLLLKAAGTEVAAVSRVLLAGAFGHHVRGRALGATGLLPAPLVSRVQSVGNSSLAGASLFLTNEDARAEALALVSAAQLVELSSNPQFEKAFIAHLTFGS
jgi:uncharacterized 2Fe-2S/4Fe-4S cluster protein (DUF4445 family)